MKNKEVISNKGYTIFPHFLLHFVGDRSLTPTNIGWLVILLSTAGFDTKHTHLWSRLTKRPETIADKFKVNPTTVHRQIRQLQKLGLIKADDKYAPRFPFFWIHINKIANKLTRIAFTDSNELKQALDRLNQEEVPPDLEKLLSEIDEMKKETAKMKGSINEKLDDD